MAGITQPLCFDVLLPEPFHLHARLTSIEGILGHTFRNRTLLFEALLHKSVGDKLGLFFDYERLEFLGDAILQFYVSSRLFAKAELNPGELTKARSRMVSRQTLSSLVRANGLEPYLIVHQSLRDTEGRINGNLPGDFFESLIASIYLDAGLEKACEILDLLYRQYSDHFQAPDYKSILQEICLKATKRLPAYATIRDGSGYLAEAEAPLFPDSPVFLAQGKGLSKKEAEQEAAKLILQSVGRVP